MASFPRGLGLLLTVCMVATRSSSAVQAGSPDSSRWWEAKQFADLTTAARRLREAGDFAGLEAVYTQGYQRAVKLGHRPAQISYLGNLGTARMLSFRYAPALEAYLNASALAEQSGDWFAVGAIAVNLSRLYQGLGDERSALSVLERARKAVGRLPVPPANMPQLLANLRSVQADLQEGPSPQDAIEAARLIEDDGGLDSPKGPEVEAAAWDSLGQQEIAKGNWEEAESAFGRALRLRTAHSPRNLGLSYGELGALRLAQAGRVAGAERRRLALEAEAFTERAIHLDSPGSALFALLHQRGQIRELLGQTRSALEDFRAAMNQAGSWSGALPAAVSLLTEANVTLQHEVFNSFVEAAAHQALRTRDRDLAAEAFLALEANRAASLRESRELAPAWRKRLPAAYWETLGRLTEVESRDLNDGHGQSAASKRLRLELTEMESIAGFGISMISAENFLARNSLTLFKQGLGESDLLLSFYLGEKASYLWAVTQNSVSLHRLPEESEVRAEVSRFREAVISGGRSAKDGPAAGERLGAELYRRLFGALAPAEAGKTSWLLSLDGALFELPFPALVSGYENGRPVYVAERHSLQRVPGALFLNKPAAEPAGAQRGFLGVGDPVYNSADPRLKDPQWKRLLMPGMHTGPGQLNRLVSSGRELERSSDSWQAATGSQAQPIQLLRGAPAARDAFLEALTKAPSTIHLATHVLTSATEPQQAFLAFSLDAEGRPGLLSTSEIGMQHVPGALVVMTGCATGTGDARVGAGLLGLTRAWMMAGAKTVVATNWPVPDADGDLIPVFYRNLQTDSPAEALRRSQVDMIHSGTWEAAPSYWAAFQVTGGNR